ncbi:hypothetical protein J6590_035269 [Homalodisca vitripennis]|nr:hypothetical protein J6590_035269 [Homalodisca vitripennis]
MRLPRSGRITFSYAQQRLLRPHSSPLNGPLRIVIQKTNSLEIMPGNTSDVIIAHRSVNVISATSKEKIRPELDMIQRLRE